MARSPDPTLAFVLERLADCKTPHANFERKIESRYNAYRGLLEKGTKAAKWTSKLHPPYLMQIVEGMLASMVDPAPRFRVRPRPKALTLPELQAAGEKGRNLERLLNYELGRDHFAEKQRPFVLQGFITGMSVAKTAWLMREGLERRKEFLTRDVVDDFGFVVGSVPEMLETERAALTVDDPTMINVDVRDFFWPEAAPSLEEAAYVAHRVYMLPDEVKALGKLGVYKNTEKIEVNESPTENTQREQTYHDRDRAKGMVEVIELWTSDRVITIGNQSVVLADKPNPFWHGQKPFVVASPMPDLFAIEGMSVVESLAHLQSMLWTLQNQRIDSTRLLNNAIVLIRADVDDVDAFEWAPGAQWLVEDPQQVSILKIDPTPAQISLQAEALLKGDLQSLMGGMPFAGGASQQTVDQKTATGVSIITSIAQQIVQARKQQYLWAYQRIGEQFVQLLQQFMEDKRTIEIIGADGAHSYLEIEPDQIQGDFDVTVELVNESLMRQEKRAEAQALVQIAGNLAPVYAAVGTPLNLKAFMEDLLDSFDKNDKERFFSAMQQGLPGVGQNGNEPQPELGPGPGGVTAPQSIAPEVSPSNQVSIAPEVFNARARSASGGAPNGGAQ